MINNNEKTYYYYGMAKLSDTFLSKTLFRYNSSGFNCLGFGYSIQNCTVNELCLLKCYSKNSSASAKDEVREKISLWPM